MIGRRIAEELREHHGVVTIGLHPEADAFFDVATGETDLPGSASADVLVHCAASFEGGSVGGMLINEQVNALGALHTAVLAERLGCGTVIYISTIFAYEHPDNDYFNSYALSKRHGQENLAAACEKLDMRFAALLLTQVYDSTGAFGRHQPLLHHILETARKGEDIVFYGNEDRVRNFMHVDDVASIVAGVVRCDVAGAYACITPWTLRLSRIAAIAYETFGTFGDIRFDTQRANIPSVYLPSDEALYERLGRRPVVSLEEGFARYRRHVEAMA